MTAPISAHMRGHERNSTNMHDFCSQPLNKVAFASRLQRSHRRRCFDPRSNILTRSWSPRADLGIERRLAAHECPAVDDVDPVGDQFVSSAALGALLDKIGDEIMRAPPALMLAARLALRCCGSH